MRIEDFCDMLDSGFFTGVPDSILQPLCDYLLDTKGTGTGHIIAANEGNAAALAAGYHLATGRIPVVYLQNSGVGNLLNPVVSLLSQRVYGIPCVFVVGYRGQPGTRDEPQHMFQGEITPALLEQIGLSTLLLTPDTTKDEFAGKLAGLRPLFGQGHSAAVLVEKGALAYGKTRDCVHTAAISREQALRRILGAAGSQPIVCTTGKASRELFELREALGQGHGQDFLTVGSMGHSSSIALGIALHRTETTVWCIDGDGAALMHMGAMAVIGQQAPANLIHIIINNMAHESVGGAPTAGGTVDFAAVASACGYGFARSISTYEALDKTLETAKASGKTALIEVKTGVGSRDDLGRPTGAPQDSKRAFMAQLQKDNLSHF